LPVDQFAIGGNRRRGEKLLHREEVDRQTHHNHNQE
jgi:hypothetical protein